MTVTTLTEYLDLWEAVEHTNLSDQPDRTVWLWMPDGTYSAKSAYARLHTGLLPFRGQALIWKTWVPLRVKIFLWLVFRRRHWTNNRRTRHGLKAREECYNATRRRRQLLTFRAAAPSQEKFGSASVKL